MVALLPSVLQSLSRTVSTTSPDGAGGRPGVALAVADQHGELQVGERDPAGVVVRAVQRDLVEEVRRLVAGLRAHDGDRDGRWWCGCRRRASRCSCAPAPAAGRASVSPPPAPGSGGRRGAGRDPAGAGGDLHRPAGQVGQRDGGLVDRVPARRTAAAPGSVTTAFGSSGSRRSASTCATEVVAELVLQLAQEERVLRLLAAALAVDPADERRRRRRRRPAVYGVGVSLQQPVRASGRSAP